PGRHEVLVEVTLGGVHEQVGQQHVVHLGDRLAARVAHQVAGHEVLEVVVPSGQAPRQRACLLTIRLVRLKSTTRSPRWLTPSVRQVTMPCPGWLRDSRTATTSL